MLAKIRDYTVVDIETTGLCPAIDEILEIGALRVRDGEIISKFSVLVKPIYPIPDFITDINGISNEMVKDAPPISSVIKDFHEFVGDDIIIGFHPSFDVNFLYDACHAHGLVLSNDFIDTRRIAKIVLPNFKEKTRRRYKLKNLVWYFKFGKQEHRALSDCIYTKMLYDKLNELAEEKQIDYESEIYSSPPSKGLLKAKDITRSKTDVTLFQGEKFVFTGKLEHMTRREAMQYVVDYGGTVGDGLTKDCDYLVMGTQDYSRLVGDKSKKQQQAEKFISQGEEINIITEDVFYDMINYTPEVKDEPTEVRESPWPTIIWPEGNSELVEKIREREVQRVLSSYPKDKAEYIKKQIEKGLVEL